VRAYFDRYYDCNQDANDIEALRVQLNFVEVAKRFAMIEGRTRAVLVPYDEGAGLIEQLRGRDEWNRPLARQLQGYQVGLYDLELDAARRAGAVYEVAPGTDVWATTPAHYDEELGFRLEAAEQLYVV
jgi:CRISPR-associated endonuclease/helicase Cas3